MTKVPARRRLARNVFFGFSAACLLGAGVAGLAFAHRPMDLVLIQLPFFGAWACFVGARVGGLLGSMMEEDGCSDIDMGVLSSMGSMIGTLATGLLGTALTGLTLARLEWWALWGAAVAVAGIHGVFGARYPLRVARLPHLDRKGRLLGADGLPLPADWQPLRMPDRVTALLAAAAVVTLLLALVMALLMGGDLGHPVMMAPMMYGMFGTMLGGMVGGWLAGLLDEHEGHPDHDNPVMVSAMALMAGMMGGMPSGMIGGMMAVMGDLAIAVTVLGGLVIVGLSWAWAMRGRYRIAPAVPLTLQGVQTPPEEAPSRAAAASIPAPRVPTGAAVLAVQGMTCDACRERIARGVGALPGVQEVEVDLGAGLVRVRWGEGFAGLDAVRARIAQVGYLVQSTPPEAAASGAQP